MLSLPAPEKLPGQSFSIGTWTLGEAFIKATGEGVAQDLSSFAFTDHGAPALIRVSADWGPPERWCFGCGA